jgi:quinol monooxygenase YgiN
VYQVTVRLTSRAEKAQEMLQALRSVMLPAEFEAGSMGCHLYAEAGETDSLCYIEEWATEQDMERTIRSIRFGRLCVSFRRRGGGITSVNSGASTAP